MRSFFGAFFSTLYGIYVLRDLHFTPAVMGLLISVGGVGALLGALLSARMPRQVPIGCLMMSALLISGLVNLLIPLASVVPPLAFVLLLIPQLIGDAVMVFYAVNEITLRQTIIPDSLLGRTGATIGLLSQGIVPLGALCGGILAARLGTGTTLLIAVCGILGVALWMPSSPLATQGTQNT